MKSNLIFAFCASLLLIVCSFMTLVFTFHGTLSYDVVKELGVVCIHPPAAGTRHQLLLGVAAQVLPELSTPFSRGFTICKVTGPELKINNPTILVHSRTCQQSQRKWLKPDISYKKLLWYNTQNICTGKNYCLNDTQDQFQET